jgi:hypothetical protein
LQKLRCITTLASSLEVLGDFPSPTMILPLHNFVTVLTNDHVAFVSSC